MKKLLKYLAPLLIVALAPLAAKADVLFPDAVDITGTQTNILKFFNFETFVNANKEVVTTPTVGDYLVSIFSASQLFQGSEAVASWSAGTDFVLGYSVYQVSGITYNGGDKPIGITYQAGGDPFGYLSGNETKGVYYSGSNWSVTGDVAADIASIAGNGPAWATFGINGGDDYGQVGVSYIGNTEIVRVAAYGLSAIQSPVGVTFVPGDYLGIGNSDDLAGIASIFKNTNPATNSGWQFVSSDPIFFKAVPEPGTLTLFAGCLALGGVLALRRRNKK